MRASHKITGLHALCFDHHIEMKAREKRHGLACSVAYACPKSACRVRYTITDGYSLAGRKPSGLTPQVICPRDEQPMYLGEVQKVDRSFRRWKCPHCSASLTNSQRN